MDLRIPSVPYSLSLPPKSVWYIRSGTLVSDCFLPIPAGNKQIIYTTIFCKQNPDARRNLQLNPVYIYTKFWTVSKNTRLKLESRISIYTKLFILVNKIRYIAIGTLFYECYCCKATKYNRVSFTLNICTNTRNL